MKMNSVFARHFPQDTRAVRVFHSPHYFTMTIFGRPDYSCPSPIVNSVDKGGGEIRLRQDVMAGLQITFFCGNVKSRHTISTLEENNMKLVF